MSVVRAGALGRRVDLVRELVLRDVRLRYRRSVLGVAWSQLPPLSLLVIMTIVFTKVIPLDIPDYPVFALTGLLTWTWFQTSMLSATVCVTDGGDLVRRPRFPVTLLPPIAIVSQLAHFLLALPVLLGAVIVLTGRLPATAVLLPLLIAIQFMVTLGPAYAVAALHVPVRDIGHALAVVLQLWFFGTPIFYDDQRLIDSSFRIVYELNPIAHLITAYRDVLIRGRWPSFGSLGLIFGAGAILSAAGIMLYRRRAHTFPEEL
ncbi:MAG: ABC transporter permease [Actinomycetota bacterium]